MCKTGLHWEDCTKCKDYMFQYLFCFPLHILVCKIGNVANSTHFL